MEPTVPTGRRGERPPPIRDPIDADALLAALSRPVVTVDRNLHVVAATATVPALCDCAAPLEGRSLADLFGAEGSVGGRLGSAVVAGRAVATLLDRGARGPIAARATPVDARHSLIELGAGAVDTLSEVACRQRLAALTSLAAALRDAASVDAVAEAAERVIGDALGARASLVLDDPAPEGAWSRAGEGRHTDLPLPSRARAGQLVAVDDLSLSAALTADEVARLAVRGTRALLSVPLTRDGRIAATAFVEADMPRHWSEGEIATVADVLERAETSAGRVAALARAKASQARSDALLGAAAAAMWETDPSGLVVTPSSSWCRLTGQTAAATLGEGWLDAIAPVGREAVRTAWRHAVARGAPLDCETALATGTQAVRVSLKAAPLRSEAGRIEGWIGMVVRLGEAATAADDEADGEADRLRLLLEGMPQLVWRAGDGGARTWSSPQWARATGQSPADSAGLGWLDAIHPEDRLRTEESWRRANRESPLHVDHRIFDVIAGRHRWFQTRAAAVTDRNGRIVEWLGTSTDIDDLRRLESEQRLLVAELQHRTRNLIAVVQSIAHQTLARAMSLGEFGDKFEQRLRSLARVQGLLSRTEGNRIGIGELVRMELDALVPEDVRRRTDIAGPEVLLRRSAVQTLTLAIHELGTNARKYGALVRDGGRLDVHWSVVKREEEADLVLVWNESFDAEGDGAVGGAGYGRELIERALPYSLQAATTYAIGPGSVRCTIRLPLTERSRRSAT